MIHSLALENFKGIGVRQRVDFGPLTLLFGPNSAGKSTVLQALVYLHELLENGLADVDRTALGGSMLELGGFARLVHRHESDRRIVIRAEFATPAGLERFSRDLTDFPFPDLDDEVESAWLELAVGYRTTASFRGPIVERALIGQRGEAEPLVWLEVGASLRGGEPLNVRVNLGHPALRDAPPDMREAWEKLAVPEDVLRRDLEAAGSEFDGPRAEAGLGDGSDFGKGRSLPVFAISRFRLSALPPTGEPLRVIPFGDEGVDVEPALSQVRTFLEMVVLGTTAQLVEVLREALYVGPLRAVPPRGFLYETAGRVTSWADGLAAWELLLADRTTLVESTNKWLSRLGAACQLVVQQLFDRSASAEEVSEDHVDKTVRRLLLDTGAGSLVLPSEVGAGVSQVIPVVVAALEGGGGLALVEQPEIHIHPAMQVGLGDLLIEAVTRERGRRTLLIETHSEHLILRLLRRIREKTENELPADAPAFSADQLSVIYVENTPEGVRIRSLRVDELGEFRDRWPKGFFAERMEELL